MARRNSRPRIRIRKSRRGAFTAYCKRQGFGGVTQACIAKGLRSKDPRVRKMANFARNSRKWRR